MLDDVTSGESANKHLFAIRGSLDLSLFQILEDQRLSLDEERVIETPEELVYPLFLFGGLRGLPIKSFEA